MPFQPLNAGNADYIVLAGILVVSLWSRKYQSAWNKDPFIGEDRSGVDVLDYGFKLCAFSCIDSGDMTFVDET